MTWLSVGRVAFGRALPLLGAGAVIAACYSAGDGTAPPPNTIYFPVGLDVSVNGNVLYVANSDFDLQYNGGTIQSYDLNAIRTDVLKTIVNPSDPTLPFVRPGDADAGLSCTGTPPTYRNDGSGQRQPIGETCAPPMNSQAYVKASVTIGAFATDLQVLRCEQPPASVADQWSLEPSCSLAGTRLFVPVRGDASVTWVDIQPDSPTAVPTAPGGFELNCGAELNAGRCVNTHEAGNNDEEPGNTRNLTMPGEPFGMAQSQDGQALVITHQTDTKASLFSTGPGVPGGSPALEFVLDGLPIGGNGVFAIPHDRALACLDGSCNAPRPAYLWTTRAAPEIHRLRYYSDDGSGLVQPPTLYRPYLLDEAKFPVTASSAGTDSRGLAIDRTPRLACKAKVRASTAATDPTFPAKMKACAQTPARVFVANRSPAALLVGEVGGIADDGSYDADRFILRGNVPLTSGPSKVYLAPIVDQDGNYALRVFVVCFDSATVFVYDPDTATVETTIRTAPGPFALAFDAFNLEDVAVRAKVPADPRQTQPVLRYRFAYLASFTESFIQVLDLDNSRPDKSTFELPVFALGAPTLPIGTQ